MRVQVPQTRPMIGRCYDLPEWTNCAVAKLELALALDLNLVSQNL